MAQMSTNGIRPVSNESRDNPKNVIIEWATDIREVAYSGKNKSKVTTGLRDALDDCSDCFSNIIGQCDSILAILRNTK